MKYCFVTFLAIIGFSAAILFEPPGHGTTRVLNGAEIKIREAPYQVSVQSKAGTHECGGTIINDRWVLTTAQCANR